MSIKFDHTDVYGWEHAIRGMRNPMESHDKSDSVYGCTANPEDLSCCDDCEDIYCNGRGEYRVGNNDHDLMMRLSNAGRDHRKFMRMLVVYVDITAPLYWWKEFDTYKVGTVANSCSTMHKIHAKEFTLEDFSTDHLMNFDNSNYWEEDDDNACFIERPVLSITNRKCVETRRVLTPETIISEYTIPMLNIARNKYNEASKKLRRTGLTDAERKHTKVQQKLFWWQMIQLLPSSYNQRRTIMLNYEVLANIYHSHKDHKLDEWRKFCAWIEELPNSEIIIGHYTDEPKEEEWF